MAGCKSGAPRSWRGRIMPAAVLCAALGLCLHLSEPEGSSAIPVSDDGTVAYAGEAYFDYVLVGDRVASYQRLAGSEDAGDFSGADQTELAELSRSLGTLYQADGIQIRRGQIAEETCAWYRLKNSANLGRLIKETAGGALSLWEFSSFLVDDVIIPEALPEEEQVQFRQEAEEEAADLERLFPGTDRSPYPLGTVYRDIYGIDGPEDILQITAAPIRDSNTDRGQQIQQAVGTHAYGDSAEIQAFYKATEDLPCYGEDGSRGLYEMYVRYAYSFSTDSGNKLSSGEKTWACRSLTLTLTDGSELSGWRYDALTGRISGYYGILSAPMAEENVTALNQLFGIR